MDLNRPVPQPRGATSLKRKSGASKMDSASNEMELDEASADEIPQPKKLRRSSTSTKSVVAGKGPRTSAPAIVSQSVFKPSMVLNSPVMSSDDLPLVANPTSKGGKKTANASQKVAVVAAEKAVLQKKLEEAQAQLAARDAEVLCLQNLNAQVQQASRPRNQLIPRPSGERGKNGWNLQRHMGLEDDYKTYSNIRRCVRYAVYESQLNIWLRITRQEEMSLFTCYGLVKKRFPLMGQFERNWATREFIKGICQNARKHCRRKGICDDTLPVELLDGDDGNDGGNGNDGGKDDGDGIDGNNGVDDDDDGDEVDDGAQKGQSKNVASGLSGKFIKGKALATVTNPQCHGAEDIDEDDTHDEEDEDEDDQDADHQNCGDHNDDEGTGDDDDDEGTGDDDDDEGTGDDNDNDNGDDVDE
ncbi:hypothetical protein M407DRAFT_7304 [Tulasnella calospora MUT 4182]|uniref:Uncharacterized protein n=1 Tax=Tulasnella calospora MUT 4182 TaxID=1051891 RepID=A0A0C3QAT0_9AGAM|nr:hypothetical protein M407DRAFT_7304 [Tulasnella calospora MUT 4182]